MHLRLASLASLALTLLSALPSSQAATTNCRKCPCTVTLKGNVVPAEIDAFLLNKVCPQITGGDGFSWASAPVQQSPGQWSGTANFPRLCGNGGGGKVASTAYYWKGAGTSWMVECGSCGKNVRCNGGSDCENSGFVWT